MMHRTLLSEHARIQRKSVHLEQAELDIAVLPEKRLERLVRNAARAGDGDVRMKRSEFRLKTGLENRVHNAPVQDEQMRMPLPHADPHHRRPAPGAEHADAAERQKNGGTRAAPSASRNLSSAGASTLPRKLSVR